MRTNNMLVTNTKRIRVNESDVSFVKMTNTQSSSLLVADKVGSCDDFGMEIILRLPVRSLLRFKSVSKHWYSVISNPSFKLFQNLTPDPPYGLYVPIKINMSYQDHEFVPFDIKNRGKAPSINLNFDPDDKRMRIVHSCNGLMLCCCQYYRHKKPLTIHRYIYNPTINQFTRLPKHEIYNANYFSGMTLAFDPSRSPYYKIVSVCNIGPYDYFIGIYTSETCTWKPSCKYLFDIHNPHINHGPGVYWNNAVHWFNRDGLFWYFNLDEEIVRQIQTSLLSLSSNYMFESRDHLLAVETDSPNNSKLKIHELKRDYSEWSVKYHVDLDQVGRSLPEVVNPEPGSLFKFRVLSVVLGEKEDESFFVPEIAGIAFRFNLVAKTFYKLYKFRVSDKYGAKLVYQFPYAHQFKASLYSV